MTHAKTSPQALARRAGDSLTTAEERVLAEVVRLINEHHGEIEDRVTQIGRIVLEKCFGNDPHAALEMRASRTFEALWARAGQRAFPIERSLLSLAVRIAVYDRLIESDRWRSLDVGRKEELLPLADGRLMATGAKHALDMNLNRRQVAEWVEVQREAHGRPIKPRKKSVHAFGRSVGQLAKRLNAGTILQLGQDAQKLEPQQRRALVKDVQALRRSLDALVKRLDAK